jgi:hypothetical protein
VRGTVEIVHINCYHLDHGKDLKLSSLALYPVANLLMTILAKTVPYWSPLMLPLVLAIETKYVIL